MRSISRLTRLIQPPLFRRSFSSQVPPFPKDLLSLADLSIPQIQSLISTAINFKKTFKPRWDSQETEIYQKNLPINNLKDRTVALMFSKRSTRTRVASESATALLGRFILLLNIFYKSMRIEIDIQHTKKRRSCNVFRIFRYSTWS
jgi:ornithine carbamoyltransferase